MQLKVNWDRYQDWDLIKLSQNYLKLILRYLNDSSSGMLIHCISGKFNTSIISKTKNPPSKFKTRIYHFIFPLKLQQF